MTAQMLVDALIKMSIAAYISLNAGLVDNLVDVVGRDARNRRRSRNIQDLSCQPAHLAHAILGCLV